MGCLFAALLTEAGHEVWLLDRSAVRAKATAQAGIRIQGIGGARVIRPKSTSDAGEIGPADLVFIWVKAYSTESAVQAAAPALAAHTRVISLQNGLGNLEVMARAIGPRNIIGGTTSHGATLLGAGSVRHAGKGETIIGRMGEEPDNGLQQVAELLSAAGIQTRTCLDVEAAIWSKLMVNVAINPLTAITRLRNGQLLEGRETRRLLDLVAGESERIAAKAGIRLAYPDIRDQVDSVCKATAQNRSSMLQDILAGRRTEVEYITGAVADAAERHGAAAPLCQCLTALVEGLTDAEREG